MKPDGIYYLNNTGNRWIIIEDGERLRLQFTTKRGRKVTRAVNYCEAFGNFAACNISWKGQKINVFQDSLLED